MNKRPEDPGPLQNDSTIFPCNNLEKNKNVRTIDSPTEQTVFRIQHRSSTATLKYFGR